MFDRLFKREAAVARHTAAPFYPERLRYLEHMQGLGAARKTLVHCAAYLLRIIACLGWKLPGSVTLDQIDAAADRWIVRRSADPRRTDGQATRTAFVSIARNWLRFLGRLQTPSVEQPGALQLEAYARFMREERNLSSVTIRTRCGRAAEFLRLIAAQECDLAGLAWEAVDRVLALKGRRDGLTRCSMQTYAYNLRSFLRYMQETEQCRPGLAAAIRPARVYQGETLPAGPSWDAVCRLLDGMQSEQPSAIRDRAIVMLFALYGLREAEVRRLCLDDLEWDQALIRVCRSKQNQRVECYPLTGAVADALAKYLQSVRPKTDRREVFLQLRAPYQ